MDNWTLNTKGRCGIPCYQKEIIISTYVRRSLARFIVATPFPNTDFLSVNLYSHSQTKASKGLNVRGDLLEGLFLMIDVFIYLRARRFMFASCTIPYYHARKIKSVITFDPLVGFWKFKKLKWLEFHNKHKWTQLN